MESRRYSKTSLAKSSAGDKVLQIEDDERTPKSKQSLICQGVLMGLVFLLIIIDSSLVSPFSCTVISPDLYNSSNQECSFNIVPITFVLLVEVAQIIIMIPNCFAALLFVFKILQLIGIFGLKIFIQSYEKMAYTYQLTPGFVGYVILCGYITASFAVDIPGENQRNKIIFAGVIGVFTAISMVAEFAFNEYQTVSSTDFWIDMSLTIPVIILIVIVYAVLQRLKKLQSNFLFGCFIIGFVPLMYLLVPALHFSNTTIQVSIVLVGVITYVIMSTRLMIQS